jgi:hypothetical protein
MNVQDIDYEWLLAEVKKTNPKDGLDLYAAIIDVYNGQAIPVKNILNVLSGLDSGIKTLNDELLVKYILPPYKV